MDHSSTSPQFLDLDHLVVRLHDAQQGLKLVEIDSSTVFPQILDLDRLVDRLQDAQHGLTDLAKSRLYILTTSLYYALTSITRLLQIFDNDERQYHAAESLSEILDRSIRILESHLEIFERGCENSDRGPQTSCIHCCRHCREGRKISRSIQRITAKIRDLTSRLETPNSNSPPTARPEDVPYDRNWSTGGYSTSPCTASSGHHNTHNHDWRTGEYAMPARTSGSRNHNPYGFNRNNESTCGSENHNFHNREWAMGGHGIPRCTMNLRDNTPQHNHSRDLTPPRGRYRHRTTHGRHVQFQDESAEIPRRSFRPGSPAPLTADEEPMVIPANVRGGRFVNVSDDGWSDEEINTDFEDDVPGQFSPSYSPPTSPPPSYTSHDNGVEDDEWEHPGTPAGSSESLEPWINPIIAGCRDVIRKEFPTACATAIEDHDRYRIRTRNSPDYRWYLNFRYMSFILQLDLPFQVFLINIRVQGSGSEYGPFNAILYLFEDCIIYAHSPFCRNLPDPNGDDEGDLDLHRGLEVLEDWPIRFENLSSVRKEDRNALAVEVAIGNGSASHHLTFQTACQRHEIYKRLLPRVMWNDLTHNQFDTTDQHHDASESSYSSSSSSIDCTTFEYNAPGPSYSRVQHGRTANYTYHSRSFGGPSHETHADATPRTTSTSDRENLQSKREFRFGFSRHRSPSASGIEVWANKSRKKHWWSRNRRSGTVGGEVE